LADGQGRGHLECEFNPRVMMLRARSEKPSEKLVSHIESRSSGSNVLLGFDFNRDEFLRVFFWMHKG
jgi:hypothetical protein